MSVIYFSDNRDQRLYRHDRGVAAKPDHPCFQPRGGCAAVRRGISERAGGAWSASGRMTRALARRSRRWSRVDLSGRATPRGSRLGARLLSTPRLSPDGSRLSWLNWRHPDMPWVATEAWVGDVLPDGTIGSARLVAGGPDEWVVQPEWSPNGDLYFVSDRGSGWWNLYRERNGAIEPMAAMDAEFGRPQWQFGMSTYAFESADRLIACFVRDGVWTLAAIDARSKRLDDHSDRVHRHSPAPRGPGRAVFIGGSPSEAPALVDLDLSTERAGSSAASFQVGEEVRRYVSTPRADRFPDRRRGDGPRVLLSALFARFAAPADRRPGAGEEPRRADVGRLEHALAVDPILDEPRHRRARRELRGSTGYGRPYRLRLETRVGPRRRRGLRRRRALALENRNADPGAAHDQRRQRRRLHDAPRADAERRARYSARARAITASATSRRSRATPTNSSPDTSTG